MESQGQKELTTQGKMLPPEPGTFRDREDLINYVRDFGANQGYVVTIKKSRKDRRVILGCDRGGVYRNRRKIDESKRKRRATSRLINCPFEAIGKKEDDNWVLTIKNGDHNHEALKDMSEHPYSRRFTLEEVRQIKLMTEAGIKPRQVLNALKQSNPGLQTTPRHLYNLKAKIRHGNLSDKSFESWRPSRSASVDLGPVSSAGLKQNNLPLKVPNFIGGKFVDSQGCSTVDVINPATQEVVSQVPLSTYEEFIAAVSSAKRAFPSWKNTPITTRQRIMFKLQELIHRDIDKLAMHITIEQGRTLKGAQGDVLRGLEVVEHACGMATVQMGEFIPNASNGIDMYCIREPLGVCAGICPLNFQAMVPLWMFPIAVTCGNTFVLKPCERNPGASIILAALAKEAGLPDGVLNIVHGGHEIVNYICDDDDVKAVSFISSKSAGMHIYARAAARGKRVQSNLGGINNAIIMPDASMDATLDALVGATFGAAGQSCMALSTAVFVGGSLQWEEKLVERAKALKVNVGTDLNADLGPVITKEVKDHLCSLIQSSAEDGARVLLDGRKIVVSGYESGNFVGPTILCDVTTNMDCYKEEIFGPVLLCMEAESLEGAIIMVNRNRYINGATIFTTSGMAARKFQNEVEACLVGINVPVPTPLSFSSLNGANTSFAGDLNVRGKAGVQFYTQVKTVAQLWKDLPSLTVSQTMLPSENYLASRGASSEIPTSSDRDSPSQGVSLSPAMHTASENDSTCHSVPLPNQPTSEADLRTTEVPSMSSTVDRNLANQDASRVIPTALERHLSCGDMSLAMYPVTERDLPSQRVPITSPHISERIYMPQTSHWNETTASTSQRTETIPLTSECMHLSTSQRNCNVALTSQRTDTFMAPTSERVYMSTIPHDNLGSLSHRSDGMATTSNHIDGTVHPIPERVYMLATSHLNDNMGQPFERTNMFKTSERLYMPATSHRSEHIGSASKRGEVVLRSTSERLYMSAASQRNDNLVYTSQKSDHLLSTSERMYTSIVHNNAEASERSYIPGEPKSRVLKTE